MPFFKRKQDKQKATSPVVKEPVSVKRTPSNRSNPQSPDSINGDIDNGVPSSLLNPPGGGKPARLLLSEDVLDSADNNSDQSGPPKSPMKTSSQLSKTLQEILHDKDALHCFIQFMESQHAERFIRFWLDANSFKAATLTRMRTNTLQSVGSSAMLKRRSEASGGDDSAESDSVCRQSQSEDTPSGGGNSANDCEKSVSESEKRKGEGESEGKSNCDSSKPNAPTENIGCASESATHLKHSPATSAQTQGQTDSEGRENKPPSFPLNPPSVEVRVTSDPDDTRPSQSPNPVSEGLLSGTNLSQSSLQDSGIAIPSDGEFVITPNSQSESPGDNESVDTLIDDDDADDDKKAASDGDTSSPVAVGGTDDSVDGEQSNEADTVISGEENSGTEAAEEIESAGRSARSMSMEEMREKLKKSIERDAVSIFTKYIAKDAPQPIGVDDTLRGETISKICKEDKQVDPECFVACQDFVVKHMDREYHQPFLDSEFHCKHQVNVLTSEQVYLADVLYNEHALCYFMEFMEQENAQHLMQLWMAVDNFWQQLIQQEGGYDGMQAQSDAMVLYDRFFSLQATTPLGFGDKIRFEVESNICRESGPLPDCFSKPLAIVLHTFEQVFFPRYLSSEIYYRYLSDLISTVQMAQDLPVRKHRRQASDASSEHSAGSHSMGAEGIGTRNTLLAAGSRGARKSSSPSSSSASSTPSTSVVGKIEEHLGTIDTDFLNPDELWMQPNKSALRLGTVNSLGQFVSEFDPHPDGNKKKGVGFFKKMINKDKEEEEMAVKVAQMILSDVANMTQMGDACAAPPTTENNSRTTATPSSLSLSSPFGSSPLFEPPPS
ncbi:A-kinase anchor protein 10, mitochondrial-like isoform X2 [Littorina saxatilis]|uniref:A-kinase anchor protein 10, mitochondrial-like isoform X2 n=1 Tax=Littorina saxatilis TaxID=31220 RepID=UPI0038B53497